MARTRQELATSVLTELAVIGASETPTADDATLIKNAYNDKYEQWADEELVYWELDEIPNAIFLPIRDIIMNEVRGSFGEPVPAAEKMGTEDALTSRLRRHMARETSGHRTEAEYF